MVKLILADKFCQYYSYLSALNSYTSFKWGYTKPPELNINILLKYKTE